MAIGTAAAIGLGVAGVGSVIGAKAQSKAAGQAADASVQASRENAALMRDIYGQNKDVLSPFIQRGNVAGDHINALLGLGGTPGGQQQGGPAAMSMPQMGDINALSRTYTPPATTPGDNLGTGFEAPPYSWAGDRGVFTPRGGYGGSPGQPQYIPPQAQGLQGSGVQTAGGGQTAQQAAESAFDIFRNSTGYQFRVNEGQDSLNSGFGASGTLQSGAALKALDDYRQNMASNEFGNYMGYLGNQQGVGLSAGSALAGVGQNYANSMAMNNNNAASAIGNAALVKGQNNPFGNALGMIGGGMFQYGMGG